MMIDFLAGLPLPGRMDLKIKKKVGSEEVKPIEESGESPDSGLNIDKDKAAKFRPEDNRSEEEVRIESYNVKGRTVSYIQPKDEAAHGNVMIDLEV